MKNLVATFLLSSLIAACGAQDSNVNSVSPILGDKQEVTKVEISCQEIDGQRNINILANATFLEATDTLDFISMTDGSYSEQEFSLNERSGSLSIDKLVAIDAKSMEFEIVVRSKNPEKTHSGKLDLDKLCNSELTQSFLDDLSDSINEASSVHKPKDEFCKYGINIAGACLAPQLSAKTLEDEMDVK